MTDKAIPPPQAGFPKSTDVCDYISAITRAQSCETVCRCAQIDKLIAALKIFASDQTRELKHIQRPEQYSDENITAIEGGPDYQVEIEEGEKKGGY